MKEIELKEYMKKRAGEPTEIQVKISNWCKRNPDKMKSGFTLDELCTGIGLDPNDSENIENIKLTFDKMNSLCFEAWQQFIEGSITVDGKKYSDFKEVE